MVARILALLPLALAAGLGCAPRIALREPVAWNGEAGPGTFRRALEHGGLERSYRLHLPPGYDPARPVPVVLNFHGATSSADEQAMYTALEAKADAEGFVAVHPDGTGWIRTWNAGTCCGPPSRNGTDDVGFVDALLSDLAGLVAVDASRVYATGFSNGAMLTYRLACERSGTFAAVAALGGTIEPAPCAPSRPVPVLHVHGDLDRSVPVDGGEGIIGSRSHPAAAEVVEAWARRNGCDGAPRTVRRGPVTRVEHRGCREGADVVLIRVVDAGHTWPGSSYERPRAGPTTQHVNATDEVWRFVSRHALPR